MPRETFDIRNFNYGIISSLDEEDINPESASNSLNIDGDAGEGMLRGIPTDTEILINGAIVFSGFEGGGLNDFSANTSTFTGAHIATYIVEIQDDSTTPEKFKWNKNGGTYTENVDISATSQALSDGVTIFFRNTVGHFNGNKWTFTTAATIPYIKQGQFIEHDGIYDLIYHDAQNNTISAIVDFYNTPTRTSMPNKVNIITGLSSDNVTLTLQNQQVHIGINGAQSYWVGRLDHGQFSYGISWAVASITNSAGEIEITTTPTHSLQNGDIVQISGATGTDADTINGIWLVKLAKNNSKTFVLTGSVYRGTTLTLPGVVEIYLIAEVADCQGYFNNASTAGHLRINTVSEHASAGGYFLNGILHNWKYSLIYDGTQESPLMDSNSDTPGSDSDYYDVVIQAWLTTPTVANDSGLGAFNKRITGVNLYRADSIDEDIANIGLYRRVASVDINDSQWLTATDDKTMTIRDYGNSYQINSVDYPGDSVTYEENSGMPENLTDPKIYYALSTAGGGYHFITKCTQTSLAGSELRRIFKSKYLRYNMFDYYTDFLEMPEPITALQYFEGFLYIFSLNKAYRVNIEGFYIQDVFEDAGCHDQFSITVNEEGMFFANFNNAWMYKGGTFSRIGDAIRQSASGGRSWATLIHNTLEDLIVISDAKKGYILFINDYLVTGSTYNFMAWAYHPSKQRWDCFVFGGYIPNASAGAFKGKDGEVYLSNASATYKLMRPTASTYTQAWEWYSQELSFEAIRQIKSITMIKADITGTVGISYGLDGATPTTSGTNEGLINTYNKSIRIKLTGAVVTEGTTYTHYIDSIEIIWRPLIGKR